MTAAPASASPLQWWWLLTAGGVGSAPSSSASAAASEDRRRERKGKGGGDRNQIWRTAETASDQRVVVVETGSASSEEGVGGVGAEEVAAV